MKRLPVHSLAIASLLTLIVPAARAWDYEGHRAINQLAWASLPTNFPTLGPAAEVAERVGFLAGEPDRWRNVEDVTLKHCNGPDHYLDAEQLGLYGIKPEQLPVFRYDFVAQLGVIRHEHPERFPVIDPAHDSDHTRELMGFLPWAIAENYAKLKSNLSYLKTYQESGGTPEEITNAQANVVYVMGVMGHYVGDASQPLHTTIHHHGWVGDNPHNYTTDSHFHSWIDGGFFNKVGGADFKSMQTNMHPARLVSVNGHPAKPEEMFQAAMIFIMDQNKLVEPLYQLEKDGKLSGEGDSAKESKAFLEAQLIKSGQFLSDIWYSAWVQAPRDTFLKNQLARRNGKAHKAE